MTKNQNPTKSKDAKKSKSTHKKPASLIAVGTGIKISRIEAFDTMIGRLRNTIGRPLHEQKLTLSERLETVQHYGDHFIDQKPFTDLLKSIFLMHQNMSDDMFDKLVSLVDYAEDKTLAITDFRESLREKNVLLSMAPVPRSQILARDMTSFLKEYGSELKKNAIDLETIAEGSYPNRSLKEIVDSMHTDEEQLQLLLGYMMDFDEKRLEEISKGKNKYPTTEKPNGYMLVEKESGRLRVHKGDGYVLFEKNPPKIEIVKGKPKETYEEVEQKLQGIELLSVLYANLCDSTTFLERVSSTRKNSAILSLFKTVSVKSNTILPLYMKDVATFLLSANKVSDSPRNSLWEFLRKNSIKRMEDALRIVGASALTKPDRGYIDLLLSRMSRSPGLSRIRFVQDIETLRSIINDYKENCFDLAEIFGFSLKMKRNFPKYNIPNRVLKLLDVDMPGHSAPMMLWNRDMSVPVVPFSIHDIPQPVSTVPKKMTISQEERLLYEAMAPWIVNKSDTLIRIIGEDNPSWIKRGLKLIFQDEEYRSASTDFFRSIIEADTLEQKGNILSIKSKSKAKADPITNVKIIFLLEDDTIKAQDEAVFASRAQFLDSVQNKESPDLLPTVFKEKHMSVMPVDMLVYIRNFGRNTISRGFSMILKEHKKHYKIGQAVALIEKNIFDAIIADGTLGDYLAKVFHTVFLTSPVFSLFANTAKSFKMKFVYGFFALEHLPDAPFELLYPELYVFLDKPETIAIMERLLETERNVFIESNALKLFADFYEAFRFGKSKINLMESEISDINIDFFQETFSESFTDVFLKDGVLYQLSEFIQTYDKDPIVSFLNVQLIRVGFEDSFRVLLAEEDMPPYYSVDTSITDIAMKPPDMQDSDVADEETSVSPIEASLVEDKSTITEYTPKPTISLLEDNFPDFWDVFRARFVEIQDGSSEQKAVMPFVGQRMPIHIGNDDNEDDMAHEEESAADNDDQDLDAIDYDYGDEDIEEDGDE